MGRNGEDQGSLTYESLVELVAKLPKPIYPAGEFTFTTHTSRWIHEQVVFVIRNNFKRNDFTVLGKEKPSDEIALLAISNFLEREKEKNDKRG